MATNAEHLIESEELTAVLEAREFAYRLLMQAFLAEPVRDQIAALAAGGAVRLFPFGAESAQIQQGIDETDRYLSDPAHATGEAPDQLTWDHTRMFIGPDRLAAPPWESAYRSEDRLLFQEQTLAVRQAYMKYGFQHRNYLSEPDDHIGLELDFMQQTCRLALDAAQAGNGDALAALCRDQFRFLNEHLLTWVPAFAADVVKSAQTGYYRGMAHLLAGFLDIDRSLLAELLQEAPAA